MLRHYKRREASGRRVKGGWADVRTGSSDGQMFGVSTAPGVPDDDENTSHLLTAIKGSVPIGDYVRITYDITKLEEWEAHEEEMRLKTEIDVYLPELKRKVEKLENEMRVMKYLPDEHFCCDKLAIGVEGGYIRWGTFPDMEFGRRSTLIRWHMEAIGRESKRWYQKGITTSPMKCQAGFWHEIHCCPFCGEKLASGLLTVDACHTLALREDTFRSLEPKGDETC